MSLKRFIKSAGVGIAVALLVLAIGVAGEIAWFALGLPGVHQRTVTPTITGAAYDRSTTISESYADISFVRTAIASAVGLLGGFAWTYRRGQSGNPS